MPREPSMTIWTLSSTLSTLQPISSTAGFCEWVSVSWEIQICDNAPPETCKWPSIGQCWSKNSEYVITHPLRVESGRKWVSIGREIRNMWLHTTWELKVVVKWSVSVEKYVITHPLRVKSGREGVNSGREIRNMWLRTSWQLKVVVSGSASVEKFGICDYAHTESWKWS